MGHGRATRARPTILQTDAVLAVGAYWRDPGDCSVLNAGGGMTPGDEVVSETAAALKDRSILLCVGGGIAAYKAAEVTRLLVRAGARVDVAMTPSAQRFVSSLTFQALAQ